MASDLKANSALKLQDYIYYVFLGSLKLVLYQTPSRPALHHSPKKEHHQQSLKEDARSFREPVNTIDIDITTT